MYKNFTVAAVGAAIAGLATAQGFPPAADFCPFATFAPPGMSSLVNTDVDTCLNYYLPTLIMLSLGENY